MMFAMYVHIEHNAPITIMKLTDSERTLQSWHDQVCCDFFFVSTNIIFLTCEGEIQEKQLEANIKAYKQDQADQDITVSLEKESEELLLPKSFIHIIDKNVHSVLCKLRYLETKLSKSFMGWPKPNCPCQAK